MSDEQPKPKRVTIAGIPLREQDQKRLLEIGGAIVNVVQKPEAESLIKLFQTIGPLGPRTPRPRPARRPR